MTNSVTSTTVSLTSNLEHQLQQASELRNLAYVVIVAEGVCDLTIEQRIALAMFYRSLQTHEAIEILVRQKLVEDARVLVRVLVEHAVNCSYMLLVGDGETAADFTKYLRYWNYILMRGLKAVDESRFRKNVSVELENETREEHENLGPRFKDRRNGEWCVDGKLHQRAAKVDEKLAEFIKQPYIEFRWLVNSEWRFAGSHVHGNADALLEQVSRSENVITIEQKYDPEDAAEALYSANFALSLVLHLIDSLLGAKNAVTISAQLKKFNGHTAVPILAQEEPIPPAQTTS